MDTTLQGNMMDKTSSLIAIQQNLTVWYVFLDCRFFVSAISAVCAIMTPQPFFNRGAANNWYYYTASIFSLGFFFSFLGYNSAKSEEKRSLSKVLFMVNFIAMSTYILSASRLSYTIPDVLGHPVEIGRYMEWITTCPVLILLIGNSSSYVGEITKNQVLAEEIVAYDYTLLVLGFVGSVTPESISFVFQAFFD